MAKGKGRRKVTKTGAVELIADIFLVVDGGRRILTADYTTIEWHIRNGSSIGTILKDKAVRSKLVDPALGVAEILTGPPLVHTAKTKLPPAIKKMKIPGSKRTVV